MPYSSSALLCSSPYYSRKSTPLLPFYALGCLLGSCVLHVYVVSDEQGEAADQLANYKQAVLSDAIVSLEVNLNTDTLYYGVWKDDNGNEISLRDMLGIEPPCSNSLYLKLCNEKYITAYNEDYLNSTDTARLLEAFGNGITEVTCDYDALTLSGNAFEEDIQKSLSMGMNAHVAKPIDVKTLFETMRGLAE